MKKSWNKANSGMGNEVNHHSIFTRKKKLPFHYVFTMEWKKNMIPTPNLSNWKRFVNRFGFCYKDKFGLSSQ
jgi:hypothetical protein